MRNSFTKRFNENKNEEITKTKKICIFGSGSNGISGADKTTLASHSESERQISSSFPLLNSSFPTSIREKKTFVSLSLSFSISSGRN